MDDGLTYISGKIFECSEYFIIYVKEDYVVLCAEQCILPFLLDALNITKAI